MGIIQLLLTSGRKNRKIGENRKMESTEEINEKLFESYYSEYFPLDSMYRWLSYGDEETFQRREFSFTLKDDIYQRWRSFGDEKEFRRDLISNKPEKIDIGAVYTGNVKHRLQAGFKEVQRELVFDIDISDYDDVRRCCQGAKVCSRCWPLMEIAVKVLKRTLNNDFGWKKLLFVFSGRRGIHCWVSDYDARHLGKDARVAVANYCQITMNRNAQLSRSNPLHPLESTSIDIIDEYWEKLLEDQDFFGDSSGVDRLMEEIKTDETTKSNIRKDIENSNKPAEQWQLLLTHKKELLKQKGADRNFIDRIKLSYCYPRIDIKVTEGFNHLLKAPFSVHPKTGKICVPFAFENVGSFDLQAVPTVYSVRVNPDELKPYIQLLDNLTEICLQETKQKKIENKENSAPKQPAGIK